MVGGYILLNGDILAQIQSDDFDNPTEISKTDFEKVYNAVRAGKELRIELMDIVTPVIAMKYDDISCSLTFAYDNEGIKLLTFVLEVTVDDTDPDNPVYTYSGVVQETEVGGGGGNCEYIPYTMSGMTIVINETYANILSLLQSGKAVYLYPTVTDGVSNTAPLFKVLSYSTTLNKIDFYGESTNVDYDNNKLIIVMIYVTLANDDTVTLSTDTITISATIS